jgi:hypothetical protein
MKSVYELQRFLSLRRFVVLIGGKCPGDDNNEAPVIPMARVSAGRTEFNRKTVIQRQINEALKGQP